MTSRWFKRNMKGLDKEAVVPGFQGLVQVLLAMAFIACLVYVSAFAAGQKQVPLSLEGPVYTLKLDSSINPGTRELLERALRTAESADASCLVIMLDTPGGLVSTLRKMVQAVMQSPVPVIVYVYPPGARAASAGAILTLSAHIAAMAPGTNIGAAHPVGLGRRLGSNSTEGKKAENDIAALAVSIARERGRNAKWAEEAVRKSVSISAPEALRLHVIDIVSPDLKDLLKKIRGRVVKVPGGRMVQLYPDQSRVIPVRETFRERVLKVIADPNVAYVLMMIGMVGIYFELAHPGAIFPGAAGAISLVLAFYALQTLSASTTGILLILLAFLLFVLELFITSHGILALSGMVALLLGSLMLFDPRATGIAISASVLWPTLVTVSIFLGTIAFLAAKASMSRPKTGPEGLIGEKGMVRDTLPDGTYMIFIHGELWRARSDLPLKPGQKVQVDSVDRLTLIVTRLED